MPVGVIVPTPVTVAPSVFEFPSTTDPFAGAVVTFGAGGTQPVGNETDAESVVVNPSDQTPFTVRVAEPVVDPGSTCVMVPVW